MNASLSRLVLTAFALCALFSMTNVACSAATDVDSGTSESAIHRPNPYAASYGGASYGGYGFGVDLADDATP